MDLSNNQINSLNALQNLQYLRFLNVSNNRIEKFDLKVTFNPETGQQNQSLLSLNISNNLLSDLGTIGDHIYLEKLDISS